MFCKVKGRCNKETLLPSACTSTPASPFCKYVILVASYFRSKCFFVCVKYHLAGCAVTCSLTNVDKPFSDLICVEFSRSNLISWKRLCKIEFGVPPPRPHKVVVWTGSSSLANSKSSRGLTTKTLSGVVHVVLS